MQPENIELIVSNNETSEEDSSFDDGNELPESNVSSEFVSERIDRYLSGKMDGYTRSYIQKLIDDGNVTINGKTVKTSYKVQLGDRVAVKLPELESLDVKAENICLKILYEDSELIVIDKPQGMVVHPAAGNYTGTLVNALLSHCGDNLSGINGVVRPGIVHRIDKDTSGVLVVAKTNQAHLSLAEQIKEHSVVRKYNAIVFGNIHEETGKIDAPIGRHPVDRKKMSVNTKAGRNSVTHFKVLERFGKYTLVECRLETGRTHQIRVHMSFIGHPVIGDPVYGSRKQEFNLEGQALHARILGFKHPTTGEYMEFESPLPEYFERLLKILRNQK